MDSLIDIKKKCESLMDKIDWSSEIASYDFRFFPDIALHQLSNIPDKRTPYYSGLASFCQLYRPDRVIELGTNQGISAIALAKYAGCVTSCDIKFTDLLDDKMRNRNIIFKQLCGVDDYLNIDYSKYNLIFVDIDHQGLRERRLHHKLNDSYTGVAFYDDIFWPEMRDFWHHIGNEKLELDWHGKAGFGMVLYDGPAPLLNSTTPLQRITDVIQKEMKKIDWLDELHDYNFGKIEHMRSHLGNSNDYCRHYYNALAAFCKLFKVKRVLEFGSEFGISSLAMAKYASQVESYDVDTSRIFDDKLRSHDKIKFTQANAKDIVNNINLKSFDFIFMDISSYGAELEQMLHQKLLEINYDGVVCYDDIMTHRLNRWWNTIQQEKVVRQDFHVAGLGFVRYIDRNVADLKSGESKVRANGDVVKYISWWQKLRKMLHV